MLLAWASQQQKAENDPLAGYPLALDFKNQDYWFEGTKYALPDLPGYNYTRAGAVSFVNGAGGIDAFAADVPPVVLGKGFEAYGPLTNGAIYSQDATNAAWISVFDGTGAAPVKTADYAAAPDGTNTADRLQFSIGAGTGNGDYSYQRQPLSIDAGATASIWMKTNDGSTVDVVFRSNNLIVNIVAVTPTFQRFVYYNASDSNNFDIGLQGDSGSAKSADLSVWQAQVIHGNFPDGGPIIATTGAAASIGASQLSVSAPNGSYVATYTFDDDSTQAVETIVSGGIFTVPTTLNRPTIKSVLLA